MSARATKRAAAKRKPRARQKEPSKASLEEMPPIDFDKAVVLGRGPEGLKKGLEWLREGRRGRPKKGEKPVGTVVKSLKLPEEMWRALEQKAQERGVTLHALLREAVANALAS